ncbi:Retrovirus-related Pol polyprotein from type-1 retrotransposable element R1 4 [Amphibalanus amphitrite]|uniref:Retrovirus-related Pol polyprotein from type-1 retrotransposable element R1 4 n=1 Tax=Amphibalanus amphitrite TaxID=1232801 RepID=A0A6A4VV43_AMPAM|nr:Retrovirus-related Pol polyprotein from type-1 retrotransposable element R1 4 [Amphibalanus amphitrite]
MVNDSRPALVNDSRRALVNDSRRALVNDSRPALVNDSRRALVNDNRRPLDTGGAASRAPPARGACSRCLSRRHVPAACPFRSQNCYACGAVGHTRAACRSRAESQRVRLLEEEEQPEPSVTPGTSQSGAAPHNDADDTTELCGVRLLGPQTLDVLNIYRPPIRATGDDREDRFDPRCLPNNNKTIIIGDINGHHPSWDRACEAADAVGERMADWMEAEGWVPLNSGEPTFASYRSGAQTAPDLAACSAPLARRAVWSLGPDLGSDHLPMVVEVRSETAPPRRVRKIKWAFHKAEWQAFAADCEQSLAELEPDLTTQVLADRFESALQRAAVRHIPRGARADPRPWALDPDLQEAIVERHAARAALRDGDTPSRERWIATKRRAAELEKKATIAHFKDFVSTTLNRPANVGRVHKTLKKWERCCDDEPRDGQAMLKGDRLIVTDRDKAEAFVQEYARVSKQVRIPKLDRDTKRQLREEHRSCRGTSKMVVSGEKTQVLVLSQWPKDAVDLSIRVAGARVEARETLNLLGVTLDRLLHFGPHCKRMRQRTRPRLQHLRRLTGRDWGLEERQLRIVANGYVRGALEHAAAAWLPAASPSHVEVLEREMREAARVITGCTRSTPTEALMAEAGLAPVTARKTTLAARFLAKARALPEEDPLRRVADATVNPRLKAVTGWRTVVLEAWHVTGVVAPIEPVLPPSVAPWEEAPPVVFDLGIGATPPSGASAETRRQAAALHLASLPQCATWAWTDGSATGGVLDGGAGGYIEWPHGESHELRAPAGKLCSSYRAEMVALRETLNYIGNHTDHEEDPSYCAPTRKQLYLPYGVARPSKGRS